MSFYNLSHYVKYGLFLQDLKDNNPYDAIVFERKFYSDLDFSRLNIKFLDQDGNNFSQQLNHYINLYSHVLLVLDESNLLDFSSGLSFLGGLSVVNLHSGISWLGNKSFGYGDDVSHALDLGLQVYEPWDMNNFSKILIEKGNKYIRLNNNDLPQNLVYFEDFAVIDQNILDARDIISFVNMGFSGFDASVLVSGSFLSHAIQALRILSDNHGYSFDLFCMSKFDLGLDSDLLNSIKKTDLLIVLIDQSYPNGYQDYLKLKLKNYGLKSLRIKFIYPEYGKLNTVMEEYKMEQVGFDGLSLAHGISTIIKSGK